MLFYSVSNMTCEGHAVNSILIEEKAGFGIKTIGETQCCGSMECFYPRYITKDLILKFIKQIDCSIWLLHGYIEDVWARIKYLENAEESLNKLYPEIWRVKVRVYTSSARLPSMVLVVLEILDFEAFIQWRNKKK